MIVAIGYKSEKPPVRVKRLLCGALRNRSSIFGIQGFMKFQVQDLKSYRDEEGNIDPVISSDLIEWRKDGELLIGEVL